MSFNRDDRGGGRGFGGRNFGPRSFDRGGGRGGSRDDRPMYQATCDNCHKPCEVPFRPTTGKPVYCSDCFEKMGGGRRSDAGRPERSDYRAPAPSTDQNKAQFDALHAKLDKILRLLEPQAAPVAPTTPTVVFAPAVEEVKEEVKKVEELKENSAPKVKKVAKRPASKKEKAPELA